MMLRRLTVLLAATLLGLAVSEVVLAAKEPSGAAQPGVTGELASPSAQWPLPGPGETKALDDLLLRVTNRTGQDIWFMQAADLKVIVKNAQGKALPDMGGQNGEVVPRPLFIKAGATESVRFSMMLRRAGDGMASTLTIREPTAFFHEFQDLAPGAYSIHVVYANREARLGTVFRGIKDQQGLSEDTPLWVGQMTGKELAVEISDKPVVSPPATLVPDLKAAADGRGWKKRGDLELRWVADAKGKPALRIKPAGNGGVLLVDGLEFGNGEIEFDCLGQSGPRQSNFLGIAFRAVDEKTHDAVYFRPFNFRAGDAEQKAHAVQYASHPQWGWERLRKEKTGQYEKGIEPPPDGDAWFHVRIVVQKPKISVFVNGSPTPSLVVDELTDRNRGGIGLWIGPGQGGHFANLKISHAK